MKNYISKLLWHTMKLRFVMLAALTLFVVSCQEEPIAVNDLSENSELSISEVLESYGNPGNEADNSRIKGNSRNTFSTLSVALARTGLSGVVSSNRLTVFAPTDAAFAELGLNVRNIASVPNLKEILLYHVLGNVVYSTDLSNGFVPTLNGAAVEVNLTNGVMINDSKVVKADIKARNGVIHAIDKVLFPPSKNLVELALSFDPEFSILVQAVIKADLAGVLANGGPYTVFAPTNAAFVALLGELGATSLDDIDKDLLKSVLLYHVAEGRVFSSDLSSGEVKTLGGSFDLDLSTLTITDARGREAGLIPALLNVQATNGVVHVIDRVILP